MSDTVTLDRAGLSDAVRKHGEARNALTAANSVVFCEDASGRDVAALDDALNAETDAYAALLRLLEVGTDA